MVVACFGDAFAETVRLAVVVLVLALGVVRAAACAVTTPAKAPFAVLVPPHSQGMAFDWKFDRSLELALVALAVGAFGMVTAQAQVALGQGVARGLYQANCASCHGADGRQGVSLVDGAWEMAIDDAAMARVIAEGWTDAGMPGFGETLSDEQIRSLVIYLRELEYQAGRGHASVSDVATPGDQTLRSSQHHDFIMQTVFRHDGVLWSVEVLPDGRLLASDRDGALLLVDPETDGPPVVIAGTPEVWASRQGGLLDVGLHPDYAENGWVYLSFAQRSGGRMAAKGMTAIVRGRIVDGAWVDQEMIFQAPAELHIATGFHFGTRLVFHDGYLFFAIGDRGKQDQAQDLSRPNGKIHRIHDDGRMPADNPFVDRDGAFPSIWTYGNRNPQGLVWHASRQRLYETEHGPRGGDELNHIVAGTNYGWPLATYGMNYNGTPITSVTQMDGVRDPITQWTPVLAVCGLAVASGDVFPAWEGDLFVGGLAGQVVQRVRLVRNDVVREQENIIEGEGRVRDVVTGPDGRIYVVFNSGPGGDTASRVVVLGGVG